MGGDAMPIRSHLRKFYRREWHALSRELREKRAGNACECTGLCGGHSGPCGARHHEKHPRTGGRVVLTCAHLHQDPRDHSPQGLMVMCQSCHLRYDRSPAQRWLREHIVREMEGQESFLKRRRHSQTWGSWFEPSTSLHPLACTLHPRFWGVLGSLFSPLSGG